MEKVLLILEPDVTEKILTEARSGYKMNSCNADEAADTLTHFQPDVLILYLFLPGINGPTILENCRSFLPLVVLALSPLITDYVQRKATQLGVSFVIPRHLPLTIGINGCSTPISTAASYICCSLGLYVLNTNGLPFCSLRD